MTSESGDVSELLQRAAEGDRGVIPQLLEACRPRLKRMVALRLDHRLQGRVDESDVVQESLIEITRRLPDYLLQRPLPFYLWVRKLTSQRLIDVHRQHLVARMRDVGREVSLHRGTLPAASSVSLAAQLLGHVTSPSQALLKREAREQVQEALASMDDLDREILALRHFEQLTNKEISLVLGLTESGATARYVRALRRLRTVLAEIPDLEP